MIRRAALVALLAAASCTRDLDVPPANRLAFLKPYTTVAPREAVMFTATGGSGAYEFAFAPGGDLSGPGAFIDPGGLYTAGSAGSAQDVLQVKDSHGAIAYATVTVTQRLAISPELTGTLPGMRTVFSASGGTGHHTFALESAPSGGSIDEFTGLYTAGPVGSVKDVVVVRDTLGDPLAAARAEVTVGGQLAAFRSEDRPVAPHESVTLFAIGGKPPYRYTIVSASSGSLVDPADAPTVTSTLTQSTALYTAGNRLHELDASSVTTDLVRVTDSADVAQTTDLVVEVGARMALGLDAGAAFPGVATHLVASGGKAPYTFGFAAWEPVSVDSTRTRGGNGGNRSGGTVDPFTGEYVPGPSPGAKDWFQVTDATGAPAAIISGPRVGGTQLPIPRGIDTCFVGDLDGDHGQDVVFTYKGDNGFGARIVTGLNLSSATPEVRSVYATVRVLGSMFPNDLARRGRDAFLLAGAQAYGSGFTTSRDLMSLDPDLAGNLSERQVALGPPWVVAAGALQLDPTYASTSYLYTDQWNGCAYPGPNGRNFMRFDFAPGAMDPAGVPTCRTVTDGCPGCNGNTGSIAAMAIGDFNGDGIADLVYVARTGSLDYAAPSNGGKVFVAFGNGTPGRPPTSFTATGHAGWPTDDPAGGEWRFEFRNQRSEAFLAVAKAPAGQRDVALFRMVNVAGEGRVFATHDPSSPASITGPFDPSPAGRGSAAIRRFVTASGAEAFVSVDGESGDVAAFAVGGFGSTLPTLTRTAVAATVPFSGTVACFPDVNADGVPDVVVASELGAEALVLLGDGSNSAFPAAGQTFGTRTHLRGRGMQFPMAVGDLDGDGFVDLATASSGGGLDVMFGGGGMFAWGPRVSTAAVNAVAIVSTPVDPDGVRTSIVLQDLGGSYHVVNARTDGGFEPAVTMTATTSDLKPVSPVFMMLTPADLGTGAAGRDFLTIDPSTSGWFIHAILNQGSRFVDVRSPPVPSADANHPTPDQCWPLPVGAGQGGVAIACTWDDASGTLPPGSNWRNLVTVFGTSVLNPDSPPATGGAGAPSIAAWLPLTSTTSSPWRYTASTPARAATMGTVPIAIPGGPPLGTAVFVIRTDMLHVVEVRLDPPPASPSNPASWHVDVFDVPGIDVDPNMGMGTVGTLAPGGTTFDALAGTSGGVLVLRRSAAGYALAQDLGVIQMPLGVGRLAAGSPGDVVGLVTNLGFGAGGSTTEVVPLLNLQDGSGLLR